MNSDHELNNLAGMEPKAVWVYKVSHK